MSSIPILGQPLIATDFPKALVEAVGSNLLDKMTQMMVIDDVYDIEFITVQKYGPVKGRDREGRVFISFVVQQKKISGLFSLFLENSIVKLNIQAYGPCGAAVSGCGPMNSDKYSAIKAVFEGKYAGLKISGLPKE